MTCSAESNDESELVCFCETVPKTNKTPLNYYKVEINVSSKNRKLEKCRIILNRV